MVIIAIIAAFISNFAEYEIVKHAFAGIRVSVCVLIFTSVLKLLKGAVVDKTTLIIYLAILAFAIFTSIPVAALVIVSGVVGIVASKVKEGSAK